MLSLLCLALLANERSAISTPMTRLERLVIQGDVAATRELEDWVNRWPLDLPKMEKQLARAGFTRGELDDCTVFSYSGKERKTRIDRSADIILCPGKRPTVSVLTTFPNLVAPDPMPPIVIKKPEATK